MADSDHDILTVRECAAEAIVAEQTIRNRIAEGRLPATKFDLAGRGMWFIFADDWDRFLLSEYPQRWGRLRGLDTMP